MKIELDNIAKGSGIIDITKIVSTVHTHLKSNSIIDVTEDIETDFNFYINDDISYSMSDSSNSNNSNFKTNRRKTRKTDDINSIDECNHRDNLTVIINHIINSNRENTDSIVVICDSLPKRTDVVLNIKSNTDVKYVYKGESFIKLSNMVTSNISSRLKINIIDIKFVINVTKNIINPVLINECNSIENTKVKLIKSKKIKTIEVKQETYNYPNSNTYSCTPNLTNSNNIDNVPYYILCSNINGNSNNSNNNKRKKNHTYYSYGSAIIGRVNILKNVNVSICFNLTYSCKYVSGLICALCKSMENVKLKMKGLNVINPMIVFGLMTGYTETMSNIMLDVSGKILINENSDSIGFISGYVGTIRRNVNINIASKFTKTCNVGLISGMSKLNNVNLYDLTLIYQDTKREKFKCNCIDNNNSKKPKRVELKHITMLVDPSLLHSNTTFTNNITNNITDNVNTTNTDSNKKLRFNSKIKINSEDKSVNMNDNINNINRDVDDTNNTNTNSEDIVNDVFNIISSIRENIVKDKPNRSYRKRTKKLVVNESGKTSNSKTSKTSNTSKTSKSNKSNTINIEDRKKSVEDPKIIRGRRRRYY